MPSSYPSADEKAPAEHGEAADGRIALGNEGLDEWTDGYGDRVAMVLPAVVSGTHDADTTASSNGGSRI